MNQGDYKLILLRLTLFMFCSLSYNLKAQQGPVFTIDITAGRVVLDTFGVNDKSLKPLDTLKYKFDVFTSYDRVYDTRHGYYLLECDTAIIVISGNGGIIKSIHKTYNVEGMAYDPLNDKVYCAVWKNNTYHFAELDIATGVFSLIRSLSDNNLRSSAMDIENRLYYIISDTRGLLKIDMKTGIKLDSVKSFTTNNCMCNVFDQETENIATVCNQGPLRVMQLYYPQTKIFKTIDTLSKYGNGYFSYESAAYDQGTGEWLMNLGKTIGVKNIRTNKRMDTIPVPFNRIRSLVFKEHVCYKPMGSQGLLSSGPDCPNSATGRISLKVTGGRKPYRYSLDNIDFDTASVFDSLQAGDHIIFVKDKHGFCTLIEKVILKDPEPFHNTVIVNNTNCYNSTNGRIELKARGCTPPYAYSMKGFMYRYDSVFTNIGPGTYTFYVKDMHNCIDTLQSVTIILPPKLSIDSLIVKNAKCPGEINGEVRMFISGGVAPYAISTDSATFIQTSKLTGLTAGKYKLFVIDSNKCTVQSSFTITEPPVFRIQKTADTTLCKGQQIELNLTDSGAVDYSVRSNTGLVFTTDKLLLDKAGTYFCEIKNRNNCTARDTFMIRKLDMDVTHDFLMPGLAFISDTVYMVNISYPEPDMVRWQVDRNSYSQFFAGPQTAYVKFTDTGKYVILMESRYNDCGYQLAKTVVIKSNTDSTTVDARYGYKGAMIKSFQVYSNPHDGENFKILVQLRDTADFNIYKIDAATGYITGEMQFANLKTHEFTAFTSTESEVYYLKLVVGRENKVIKVVAVR